MSSMSLAAPVSAVPGPSLLDDDTDAPILAAQYAELTRDFLAVPAEIAFALNDSAAATIAAMMARRGMVPPPSLAFCPHPDEIAEITLYNEGCQVLARVSFDTRRAGSMPDIEAWLERVRSGDRLLDFGVDIVRSPATTGEMAHAIAGRLWDALIN